MPLALLKRVVAVPLKQMISGGSAAGPLGSCSGSAAEAKDGQSANTNDTYESLPLGGLQSYYSYSTVTYS